MVLATITHPISVPYQNVFTVLECKAEVSCTLQTICIGLFVLFIHTLNAITVVIVHGTPVTRCNTDVVA